MTDHPIRVFLDANILAKPITRSLVMLAADASGYSVAWSRYAEAEADRHLVGHRMAVAGIRAKAEQGLSPSGIRNWPD